MTELEWQEAAKVGCLFIFAGEGARATTYQTRQAFSRTIGCPALQPNAR